MLLTFLWLINMVNGSAIAPVKKYNLTPVDVKIPFQSIELQTPDDCTLQAWYMPTLTSLDRKVTMVIANSDAGNMGHVLPYALPLYQAGYDILTFDYRGFGASDSYDFHPAALYLDEYRTDFQTAIRWLKKRQPAREICVLAFSMGTWIAATSYATTPFDYFVGEAVIYRPDLIVERIKELNDATVLLPNKVPNGDIHYQEMRIPFLLFAGRADSITTVADCEILTRYNEIRSVVTYDGEHLAGVATLGTERYFDYITRFIRREGYCRF